MKTYIPTHKVQVKDLKTGQVKLDITNDVVSIATNKAYGRAAGTFQTVLTWRMIEAKGYDQWIGTNDVVTIELDAGKGKGLQPVMLGLVDRPARHYDGSQTEPCRNVIVGGRDFGKLLMTDIGWDISGAQVQIIKEQGGGIQQLEANYLSRIALQTGTPAQLIEQLYSILIQMLDSSANNILDLACTSDDNWEVWDSSLQYIRDTTAWQAMERYSHRPWNMLTTETIDLNTFQVLLERNPINARGKLTRTGTRVHEIGDEDIVVENTGTSDGERVNLLCYWPTMYKATPNMTVDIVMADKNLTIFNEDDIKLNGYNPMVIEDIFNPVAARSAVDSERFEDFVKDAIPRAQTFWQWYSTNHELESGTFVIHGNPDIKAGDMLLVRMGNTGDKKEYLIEQVGHSYSQHPEVRYRTTMHVTRGQLH